MIKRPKSVEMIETEQKIEQDAHWQEIRERAAIAAMHGYLISPIVEGINPNPSREEIVEHSLAIADELVKQLKNKAI